ncbi:MAG: EF-P lysine aminoacylase EpmA [Gammaproteobacteria bacterium]
MAFRPTATRDTLLARAQLIARIRRFFADREVLEVQTPVLSRHAIPTPQIDSFAVSDPPRFLRTSPELAHKRLLASGSGDIYELGPVFRRGEQGVQHNSEFTLLEWYRLGLSEHQLMDEVAALLGALLDSLNAPPQRLSYAQAVSGFAQVDVFAISQTDLAAAVARHMPLPETELTRDDLLDLLFCVAVAPSFPAHQITFVYDYPATQAVLAAINPDDARVARRFEAYVGALELANGFYELRDAGEQRARFASDNATRQRLGKPTCTLDEAFLSALEFGLPECAGVAVGVDRLVMLATDTAHIRETIAFDFDHA